MSDKTQDDPFYIATMAMMPMLRLQGLTMSTMIERNVMTRTEARALIKETGASIDQLRVSDEIKTSLRNLYGQLEQQV